MYQFINRIAAAMILPGLISGQWHDQPTSSPATPAILFPLRACLFTAIVAWSSSVSAKENTVNSSLQETAVFVAGQHGYHTFRIPAIIATTQGTLLAFCEGRKQGPGDSGDIDLLLSRSTDEGVTWSKPTVVWQDGGNTCGNPTPVVDQDTGIVWLAMCWNLGTDQEQTIVAGKSMDVRHPYVTFSTDDGQNWAPPRKISGTASLPGWRWYAVGPGNAIQLTRGPRPGRLLMPANHSEHFSPQKNPSHSHVLWSDDQGQNWQIGGIQEAGTNESALVERIDGSILQIMRSHHDRNLRAMSVSQDGGATWGQVYHQESLVTPVCQASVLRYSWPEQQELAGRSRILFATPRGAERSHLTIWLSYDEGKTWPTRREVYAGSAAYSCLVGLPKNQVGVLYEKDNYRSIAWARFPLTWLEGE